MTPLYKRVVLKISGEALAGNGEIYDSGKLAFVAKEVKQLTALGCQVAIVTGAGNIWRGRHSGAEVRRAIADHMGMLATGVNALALAEALHAQGLDAAVLCSRPMPGILEVFSPVDALRRLAAGQVLVLAGGTGSPFFSTDTAVVLRALELEADAVLMAKNIDGVYEADPKENPAARRYKRVRHLDCIRQSLRATDLTAAAMAHEFNMTLECFALQPGLMVQAVCGQSPGTRIDAAAPQGGEFY